MMVWPLKSNRFPVYVIMCVIGTSSLFLPWLRVTKKCWTVNLVTFSHSLGVKLLIDYGRGSIRTVVHESCLWQPQNFLDSKRIHLEIFRHFHLPADSNASALDMVITASNH